jgi:PEP-CTERM motif
MFNYGVATTGTFAQFKNGAWSTFGTDCTLASGLMSCVPAFEVTVTTATAVPEPLTFILLGFALAGLLFFRGREPHRLFASPGGGTRQPQTLSGA